jgi:hypothetical protein
MSDLTSKNIHDAFRFVRTVTEELDDLIKALDESITKVTDALDKYKLAYDTNEDEQMQSPPDQARYYWLCDAYCISCALSEKRRGRNTLGYLYYLFDFGHTGGPADKLSQAVVGVGYVGKLAAEKHPDKMDIKTFFPWRPTEDDEKGNRWKLNNDSKIWVWDGGASNLSDLEGACWIYFVPLGTIRNHNEVADFLVKPFMEILVGHQEGLSDLACAVQFENGEFKAVTAAT